MARDENGVLTIIDDQEARDEWVTKYKDLLELDEREPVVQTGLHGDLALTQDGRLYEKRGDPLVYCEVTELADVVRLHLKHLKNCYDDEEWIAELADGSFYRYTPYNGEWIERKPIHTKSGAAPLPDEFTVTYEDQWICNNHSESIKVHYSYGQFTRTLEQYVLAHKPFHTEVSTVRMTIIEHSQPIKELGIKGVELLLSDEGEVYSVPLDKVIQRIMVQKRPGKAPLF